MRLNFSVLSTAVLAIAAAFGLCSCVGYESSESSPNGYREETWYKGAGFFYLDRIMFDKEGEESAFSTKKKITLHLTEARAFFAKQKIIKTFCASACLYRRM